MSKRGQVISLRLKHDLLAFIDQQAELEDRSRAGMVAEVFQAWRERRLELSGEPRPLIINDGSVPVCPALVCLNPR